MAKVRFNIEEKIIHHLMLKSFEIESSGLFEGKMGISIFFFHYAKYMNNTIYEDFAGDLLDEIIEGIHKEIPINFAFGLSGIAWSIEYLIQNNIVEGDSNEICEELDKKIMMIDPRRLEDTSLEIGMEGLANYVLARINGAVKQSNPVVFDNIYINDLVYALKKSLKKDHNTKRHYLCRQLISFVKTEKYVDYQFDIKSLIDYSTIAEKRIYSAPLGLKDGLTGYLLKQII